MTKGTLEKFFDEPWMIFDKLDNLAEVADKLDETDKLGDAADWLDNLDTLADRIFG